MVIHWIKALKHSYLNISIHVPVMVVWSSIKYCHLLKKLKMFNCNQTHGLYIFYWVSDFWFRLSPMLSQVWPNVVILMISVMTPVEQVKPNAIKSSKIASKKPVTRIRRSWRKKNMQVKITLFWISLGRFQSYILYVKYCWKQANVYLIFLY